MPGRIPQSFIDELVSRADIVQVIDERVPLKKAGRDYVARCPFHDEKTPSFSVSPTKQFYYCFGCGAHGTAIGFLMDYAGLEFLEAVQELADRAGLEVPREAAATEPPGRSDALYAVLAEANAFFRHELREHPPAIEYLKGRGLGGETAAKFQLGYAPAGWDSLLRSLGGSDVRRADLVGAGLAVEKEHSRLYDRFRDRITFPIRDRRGRVVGFGARTLGAEEPKYLNSPETPVFHKGQELYGLFEARQASRSLERLYVVEGYMDVVALSQAGITNAVATLGTSATAEHIQRLFRTTPRVIFCFDGDAAGRRAAWRALETLLPQLKDGWLASFMFLPDGEDPDSLVRARGAEGFAEEAARALTLSEFLFQQLGEEVDTATLDGRARLVELARPLLSDVAAQAYSSLLISRLAELSGMPASKLTTLMGKEEAPSRRAPRATRVRPRRGSPSLIRKAVAMLLHEPGLGAQVDTAPRLRDLALPGADLLSELLEFARSHPTISTGSLVEHFRAHTQGKHLAKLVVEGPPTLTQGLEVEFKDAIQRLDRMVDAQRFEELASRARSGSLTDEEEREFSRLAGRTR